MRTLKIAIVFNRNNRLTKNGEAAVSLRIHLNADTRFFSMFSVKPSEWDETNKKVKNRKINGKPNKTSERSLNNQILEYIQKAERFYDKQRKRGLRVSAKEVKDSLSAKEFDGFIKWMESEIENDRSISFGSKGVYNQFIQNLKDFKDRISFDEIDRNLIHQFDKFLQNKSNSNNPSETISMTTVGLRMNIFKKFVNIAKVQNKINVDPFLGYKIKKQKFKREYLEFEELLRLENLDVSKRKKKEQLAKDIFLFCCYTGLRISDVMLRPHRAENKVEYTGLKVKELSLVGGGYRLRKITKKTNTEIDFNLGKLFGGKPNEIIKKYIKGKRANDFLFNKITSRTYTVYLRKFSKELNFEKVITSHSGRHSFAMILLENYGVRVEVLQKLLGHADIKTTMKYTRMSQKGVDNELNNINW